MFIMNVKQVATKHGETFGGRPCWEPFTGDALNIPMVGWPIVLKTNTGMFISTMVVKIEPYVTGFRCTTDNSIYEVEVLSEGEVCGG